RRLEVPIHKGVYLGVKGPSYETAAEIRMAERIGADAVGMSTVPEVITAAFRGLRVLGISFISNMATGISTQKLDHEEVTRMAEQVQDRLSLLVTRILQRI
ncbi:MAG: purine-nucleoside phosphorylase, partial [candidate division KSB1 bacterium]|nr:purine-nucleoside phosphorylase [candidate division KSB1 bacterium]